MRIRVLLLVLLLLSGTVPADDYPSHPEARKVALKGTRNTRDLGGLPVSGGTFPRGRVFRSGALCFASHEDAEKLLGLGIATIIELRLANEIAKDGPDKAYLTQGVAHLHHWPMAGSRGPGLAAYESYMEENDALFQRFFTVLSKEESYPVLFHCSAGKDRTGILTALLLDLVGTPRELIYDDYLHSMRITPALKVDKVWMDAVFKAVDDRGGIVPFLRSCGVTEQQIAAVRAHCGAR